MLIAARFPLSFLSQSDLIPLISAPQLAALYGYPCGAPHTEVIHLCESVTTRIEAQHARLVVMTQTIFLVHLF